MMFVRQFASVVIWVLIGAAVVSVAVGERVDGIAIITIVVLNAIVGFFQEYRAEQAVAALAEMTAPRARVIRDGEAKSCRPPRSCAATCWCWQRVIWWLLTHG